MTAKLISAFVFTTHDSTVPFLHKSEISSLYVSSVAVQQLFVSDLVGNPEDRFSHNEAKIRAHDC